MDILPDDALDADIAVLGKKGRGKTYVSKTIVERLLTLKRRVLVLDVMSVWWGLRASADGQSPGFPIAVFGGPHADMPLTDTMGSALARMVAENNLPTVLDMGEMKKAAWQRLVADLFDELFARNRDPLWIVLEEADVFAPQQPREGDSIRVLGEVDRLARRGRAYGFRLISITQRPARLHKDVLTQLSTLIALGLTSPQDRDAIKSWVEGNADREQAKAVMDSLAKLPVGEGWVWSPDHDILSRVKFPKIKTLDTSSTPKAGAKRIEPKTLADVDVSAIEAILSAASNEGEKSNTPSTKASAEQIKEAEQRGYARGHAEAESAHGEAAAAVIKKLEEVIRYFQPEALKTDPKSNFARWGNKVVLKQEPRSTPPAPKGSNGSAPSMNSAAKKMLAVLDTNPPVKRTWSHTAHLAGLKAHGGHFNTGRKELVSSGLVAEDGDLVQITKPSHTASAHVADPKGLVGMWKNVLSGAAPNVLQAIFDRGGKSSREQVADDLGLKPHGGHWNTAWKELRVNGIVEESGSVVRLSSLFQP